MKHFTWLAALLLVTGCSSSAVIDGGGLPDASPGDAIVADVPVVDGGPTCTVGRWDPSAGTFDEWPDPRLVVASSSTATGVRLHVDETQFATLITAGGAFASIFTDLGALDGFGVNAQAFLRFTRSFDPAMLPTAEQTMTPTGGVGFVVLSPGTPRLEGALLSQSMDMDGTLFLAPLHPLPANAHVAVFVTRRLTVAARGCLEPSAAMATELAAPTADDGEAITALMGLGVITGASDLVALDVFPTQTTTDESEAVAADIAPRSFTVSARHGCTDDPMGRWRQCELEFVAQNYLDAMDHLPPIPPGGAATPQSTYTLPVTVWLPPVGVGTPPYRVAVFGHGLGSGRLQGDRLADFAGPLGFATVAIDAWDHGAHPLNPMPDAATLPTVLNFFALGAGSFDALAVRDHFRGSSYDKLQLVRLLQGGVDVDGDGTVELATGHLTYLGVSLGGIMGPEPLALTDGFDAAVLAVPGGRVSAIISDSATFAPIVAGFRPAHTSIGDVARFFPILQTLFDRGDSASYGPHVLHDRLVPGGSHLVPSAVLGIVLDDDTVPNVSNYTLARAMGVGIVPPLLRAAPGLVTTAAPPISGNFGAGMATAGVVQFDVIRETDGSIQMATHSNVGDSDVGAEEWFHFLSTHWTAGLAEIEDPYLATGLAHMPMP